MKSVMRVLYLFIYICYCYIYFCGSYIKFVIKIDTALYILEQSIMHGTVFEKMLINSELSLHSISS